MLRTQKEWFVQEYKNEFILLNHIRPMKDFLENFFFAFPLKTKLKVYPGIQFIFQPQHKNNQQSSKFLQNPVFHGISANSLFLRKFGFAKKIQGVSRI